MNESRLSDPGLAFEQNGEMDEAIVEYQKALRIKPDYALAHNNLGYVLLKKGEVEEAIVQFEEVVRLKPNDITAQIYLEKVRAVARHGTQPYPIGFTLDTAEPGVEKCLG